MMTIKVMTKMSFIDHSSPVIPTKDPLAINNNNNNNNNNNTNKYQQQQLTTTTATTTTTTMVNSL